MSNNSDNLKAMEEVAIKINENGSLASIGYEQMLGLQNPIDDPSQENTFVKFHTKEAITPDEDTLEKYCQRSMEQKQKLIEIWKSGGTVLLTIEKEATDDHPVADLVSEDFNNWRFQLSRRLCVKGF